MCGAHIWSRADMWVCLFLCGCRAKGTKQITGTVSLQAVWQVSAWLEPIISPIENFQKIVWREIETWRRGRGGRHPPGTKPLLSLFPSTGLWRGWQGHQSASCRSPEALLSCQCLLSVPRSASSLPRQQKPDSPKTHFEIILVLTYGNVSLGNIPTKCFDWKCR